MPTRYLKESICTSDNLALVSGDAERCFWRLVVLADDFGRFDGRLSVIRGKGFSVMLDKVSEKDIARWLAELTKANLIAPYSVNGKPYIQVVTLTEHNHPRAQTSKYPEPPARAGNCMQVQTDADSCAHVREGVTESESESESKSESNKGAAAPQPPKSNPKQAASLPAAIQVYEDNGGKYKSGKLSDGTTYKDKARQFITEHVTDTPESLALWGRVVAGYTAQWAKTSYTIMVNDYYLMGYAPGDKKPGRSNHNGNLAKSFGLSSLSGGAKAPEPTAEFIAEWNRLNEPERAG